MTSPCVMAATIRSTPLGHQGHRAAGGIADQALQLVAPMGGDLGVGVERKALHAGTAGTGKRGRLALGAKACANAPNLLASSLAKGDALLHRGRHGAGQLGGVIDQRIISRGHGDVEARFQVPELPQFANDAPADLLDHVGDVSVSRWLARKKTRCAPLVGTIQIDPLKKDKMIMHVHIDGTAKTLEKGHRPWLHLLPWDPMCDRV